MLLSWTIFTLQCTRNVIPVLSSDVINICGKFVTQLKQKINSSKLNNHLEKKAIIFQSRHCSQLLCQYISHYSLHASKRSALFQTSQFFAITPTKLAKFFGCYFFTFFIVIQPENTEVFPVVTSLKREAMTRNNICLFLQANIIKKKTRKKITVVWEYLYCNTSCFSSRKKNSGPVLQAENIAHLT